MAPIGYGYGSECHLLRWIGRHRNLFDQRVSAAVAKPCSTINWMDFKFNEGKLWPDSELRGLEFLYDRPNLKAKWQEFWPTGRGIHNWDAVGWISEEPHSELLLLEAKAYVGELESTCGATEFDSIQKIDRALDKAKGFLGADPKSDWKQGYYQTANRVATLYFLTKEGIAARLVFLYFLGDEFKGKQCPKTEEEWNPAINAQWEHLGTTSTALPDRIHKLFLPVAEPLSQ